MASIQYLVSAVFIKTITASMRLQPSVQYIFTQLVTLLNQLNDTQYQHGSRILSGSSIGQHVRHIIEMFSCLQEGYRNGIVQYENRKRNSQIESDRAFAIAQLQDIYNKLINENKPLVLETSCIEDGQAPLQIDTNYYREIAYNLEHAIHHMALIKVGIGEVADFIVPEDFGVAPSTIKFRAACAQ